MPCFDDLPAKKLTAKRLSRLCAATLFFLSTISLSGQAQACTTAVISGRATVDGRPLLWKNRDYWQRNNELVHDDSGTFAFVGVANAEASLGMRMGVNTAGFCIENSTSRDLVGDNKEGPNNGELIRIALQTCRTVDDFAELLKATDSTGRRTHGNFGVIDALGGAMMFEAGPTYYTSFDANDPKDSPNGIIVRSNFATTAIDSPVGDADKYESAYSFERYSRAKSLCDAKLGSGGVDVQFLLQRVCRDIGQTSVASDDGHLVSKVVSSLDQPGNSGPTEVQTVIDTSKLLNRGNTVAAVVFHGVKDGESPALTTMWAMLGEPMFTVAVPCWASQGGVSPLTNGEGSSDLCNASIAVRSGHYLPKSTRLIVNDLPGVQSRLNQVESGLLRDIRTNQNAWRTSQPSPEEQFALHSRSVESVYGSLQTLNAEQEKQAGRASTLVSTPATAKPSSVDYHFDGGNDKKLTETINSAGEMGWSGGLTDGRTHEGAFRIRRNLTKPAMRYHGVSPRIQVRGDDSIERGYLVVEIAGWKLYGKTIGEQVRVGFSSQADNDYHSAAMVLERTSDDTVTLHGIAFGDGGIDIESTATFPADHPEPLTLVLEVSKVEANPDEGDTGGTYRVHYRESASGDFQSLSDEGRLRRRRNGNQIHIRTTGLFGAKTEYFDIDRIFYTTDRPLD